MPPFRHRFEAKSPLDDLMRDIATHLVTLDVPAFIGLKEFAAAPAQYHLEAAERPEAAQSAVLPPRAGTAVIDAAQAADQRCWHRIGSLPKPAKFKGPPVRAGLERVPISVSLPTGNFLSWECNAGQRCLS